MPSSIARPCRQGRFMTIVVSSSATVYGDPASDPIREDLPFSATRFTAARNSLLRKSSEISQGRPGTAIGILQYFPMNRVAGEHPTCIPDNLLPYIAKVASGSGTRSPCCAEGVGPRSRTDHRESGNRTVYSVLEMIETFCGKRPDDPVLADAAAAGRRSPVFCRSRFCPPGAGAGMRNWASMPCARIPGVGRSGLWKTCPGCKPLAPKKSHPEGGFLYSG